MPDITMCANDKCKDRKTCYRFLAIPTPGYQSYFAFPKLLPKSRKECDNYWVVGGNNPSAGKFRTNDVVIRGRLKNYTKG